MVAVSTSASTIPAPQSVRFGAGVQSNGPAGLVGPLKLAHAGISKVHQRLRSLAISASASAAIAVQSERAWPDVASLLAMRSWYLVAKFIVILSGPQAQHFVGGSWWSHHSAVIRTTSSGRITIDRPAIT